MILYGETPVEGQTRRSAPTGVARTGRAGGLPKMVSVPLPGIPQAWHLPHLQFGTNSAFGLCAFSHSLCKNFLLMPASIMSQGKFSSCFISSKSQSSL